MGENMERSVLLPLQRILKFIETSSIRAARIIDEKSWNRSYALELPSFGWCKLLIVYKQGPDVMSYAVV
jgi:hypothetical protein